MFKSSSIKNKQKVLKEKDKHLEKMNEAEEKKSTSLCECERRDVKAREDQKRMKSNLKSLNKNLEKERQKLEDLKTAPDRLALEIEQGEERRTEMEKSLSVEDQKYEHTYIFTSFNLGSILFIAKTHIFLTHIFLTSSLKNEIAMLGFKCSDSQVSAVVPNLGSMDPLV